MYYIFDDDSGKYLHITREQPTHRGKTIIKIRKVERKADAKAYTTRERAEQIINELNEHGAHKIMDLLIIHHHMPYVPAVELVTTEQAVELAEECGLITDKDSYKAFGAFWSMLHRED